MSNVKLDVLVSRLDAESTKALEMAVDSAAARGHFNVEIEHWLVKLMEGDNDRLKQLIDLSGLDVHPLSLQLKDALDKLSVGSGRTPGLSPLLVDWLKAAWMLTSIDFKQVQIKPPHLWLALVTDDKLLRLTDIKVAKRPPFEAVKSIIAEEQTVGETTLLAHNNGETKSDAALAAFTINLTALAREGRIDCVVGRDHEIRQTIDVLIRRRQNNPILTGEAGVGKTAIAEGLAIRIAQGEVPEPLKNVALHSLDLGLLQAGAGVKGEFEQRLNAVISAVKHSSKPIILFVDEAHSLIGAGGREGQNDAANLLKPVLARGELRTIAATTYSEYKQYFEKDPALSRRFQMIKVEEPNDAQAVEMMRAAVAPLQAHHGVRILDEAVIDSVHLCRRFVTGRQLPDKSLSALDTACARVALSQKRTPCDIAQLQSRLNALNKAIANLQQEHHLFDGHNHSLAPILEEKESIHLRLKRLERQWRQEQALIGQIRNLEKTIAQEDSLNFHSGHGQADETAESIALLRQTLEELKRVQGDRPMIHAYVNRHAIADVIANWTGIPVGRMIDSEIQLMMNLQKELGKRIVGQDRAISIIAERVKAARAGLTDPNQPNGVFLLVGPSGVGKTETAFALAELLYGGRDRINVINMSEFKEEHKVSMLLGAPPGYVGFGQGGVLTEAVRRQPYSVVLLDEMEKAHPGVQDIFYQLFDKGVIKDGEGRDIDFSNTLILMTSNAGAETLQAAIDNDTPTDNSTPELQNLQPVLLNYFKPAFLARTTTVVYQPLKKSDLIRISELKVEQLKARVKSLHRAELVCDESVMDYLVRDCESPLYGARNIEQKINGSLLPILANECLQRLALNESVANLEVTLSAEDKVAVRVN